MIIRIGTRKSRLAMVQTELVKRAIEQAAGEGTEIEIVPVVTQGDQILNRSLTASVEKAYLRRNWKNSCWPGRSI